MNGRQAGVLLAGWMGFVIALAMSFFILAMPTRIFESLVLATGIASISSAAAPPLGDTARMFVAVALGMGAGALVSALFVFLDRAAVSSRYRDVDRFGENDLFIPASDDSFAQAIRRPFFAREELGQGPLDVAIPAAPVAPVEAKPYFDLAALRAVSNDTDPLDLGDWPVIEEVMESHFEPIAIEPAQAEPLQTPSLSAAPSKAQEDDSIAALMRRLEAGLEQRTEWGAGNEPPAIEPVGPRLRTTLDELRKMATRN